MTCSHVRCGRRRHHLLVVAGVVLAALLLAAAPCAGSGLVGAGPRSRAAKDNPAVVWGMDGKRGRDPKGQLTAVGADLFGFTAEGGASDGGVVFRIPSALPSPALRATAAPGGTTAAPSSKAFPRWWGVRADGSDDTAALVQFNSSTDGYEPHHAALVLAPDGYLYGCTLYGPKQVGAEHGHVASLRHGKKSSHGYGTLFRLLPNGTHYEPLYFFGAHPGDGKHPHSGPLYDAARGVLWGTTSDGGEHDHGTIFRYELSSRNLSFVYSFRHSSGSNMHARLTLDSTGAALLGMTRKGGASDGGVLFSYTIDAGLYFVLKELDASTGFYPRHGFLTRVGDTVYGLTSLGGEGGLGTIFSVREDGAKFSVLHSFCCSGGKCAKKSECVEDGCRPFASPIYLEHGPRSEHLFATTRDCGAHAHGAIVRFKPDGTKYKVVASLHKHVGSHPIGALIADSSSTYLYGTTEKGGPDDLGAVFVYTID